MAPTFVAIRFGIGASANRLVTEHSHSQVMQLTWTIFSNNTVDELSLDGVHDEVGCTRHEMSIAQHVHTWGICRTTLL